MSGQYVSAPSLTDDDWQRIEYWRAIVSGGPDCHVSIPAALLWRLIEVADAHRAYVANAPSGAK